MAQIKVVNVFTLSEIAKKASSFTGKDGQPVNISAREAGTYTCVLAEVLDGLGHVVTLRMPEGYLQAPKVNDELTITCSKLAQLERPFPISDIQRHSTK